MPARQANFPSIRAGTRSASSLAIGSVVRSATFCSFPIRSEAATMEARSPYGRNRHIRTTALKMIIAGRRIPNMVKSRATAIAALQLGTVPADPWRYV